MIDPVETGGAILPRWGAGGAPCAPWSLIASRRLREARGFRFVWVAGRETNPFCPLRRAPVGSVSYLEAMLHLCTRHQLRQLLARVEHARLHGRLIDANDFGNLLDRLAVVVS